MKGEEICSGLLFTQDLCFIAVRDEETCSSLLFTQDLCFIAVWDEETCSGLLFMQDLCFIAVWDEETCSGLCCLCKTRVLLQCVVLGVPHLRQCHASECKASSQARKWHHGSHEAFGKTLQKGDTIGCMLDLHDKTICELTSWICCIVFFKLEFNSVIFNSTVIVVNAEDCLVSMVSFVWCMFDS